MNVVQEMLLKNRELLLCCKQRPHAGDIAEAARLLRSTQRPVPETLLRKISVALIDNAKEHSKNTEACGLMLETDRDNDIGNKLYSKTSFEPDNDHNYYFWEVEN